MASMGVAHNYLLPSVLPGRPRTRMVCCLSVPPAGTGSGASLMNEEIVIVGAGIAGLATAVALHKQGIRSLVIEQADSLRTEGTSLTLFKNGWKVLDSIGVGTELRNHFLNIQGMVVKSKDGRELRSFNFKDEDESQEVRAVERRVLLETLASHLPSNTISFSSKLKCIETSGNCCSLLTFQDDSQILAEIVIGCDGIRSPVAKWMGFPDPKYVGHCAFRGLALYPDGQPFEAQVTYLYGRGVRAGYLPLSPTKVYWFVCFNRSSPGPKVMDPSILKMEVQKLVQGWPSELVNIIESTPEDTIIRTPLVDRWLWPGVIPPASMGQVVLAGDAWHPMTPNLGQGACCALEDALVLAKTLGGVINHDNNKFGSVEEALRWYWRQRLPRIFPLTIRANLVGALLQLENPVVCYFRDNVVLPKLVRLGPMLAHTTFDLESIHYS